MAILSLFKKAAIVAIHQEITLGDERQNSEREDFDLEANFWQLNRISIDNLPVRSKNKRISEPSQDPT
jgi:hypothetical protein